MNAKAHKYTLIFSFIILCFSLPAQEMTRVKGKVFDANTGEPIPFAAVSFKDKNIGTTTDFSGNFYLESGFASNIIVISSLGYERIEMKIEMGSNNYGLEINMKSNEILLDEVNIVAEGKKRKYKNKGNPAVLLIRKVIEKRDENRISSLDTFSIDRYRKIGIDINNITERFMKNPVFNNIPDIFNYVDTSEVNGKPYLPIYINETISTIYEQKNPSKHKEVLYAEHSVGFEELIDGEGIASMMSVIYQEVDIYDGSISFLSKDFVSPIANIAPSVYRYYILDTVMVDDIKTIELGFIPRNDAANAFKGKIWISMDSTYAVKKAELGKMDNMNLNWVNTFLIELNFTKFDDIGMFLTESHSTIDFDLAAKGVGAGIYGNSTFIYKNLQIGKAMPDSVEKMDDGLTKTEGYDTKSVEYWKEERFQSLTAAEEQIKVMSDEIQALPRFKTFYTIMKLFTIGYWDFGPVSLGPVSGLYEYNPIEGFRTRLGIRSTEKLSYHWEGKVWGAYGFGDQTWKYGGHLKYMWDREKLNFLQFTYMYDYQFPGKSDFALRGDNFLISFNRGSPDKMLAIRKYDLNFSWELGKDYLAVLNTKAMNQEGLGSLHFIQDVNGEDEVIESFSTFEVSLKQRYSPHQKYYQGDYYRTQITTKYPIYELTYTYGQSYEAAFPFNYNKLNLRFYKRNTMGILGYNDVYFEVEKTFGDGIPFLFMRMHTANQTYNFEEYGANMMNYLEFVSDQYAYFIFTHYFDGLILNQVPLFKRLKWRSLVSARFLYGSVRNENNPDKSSNLVKFPTDIYGNTTTFTLDEKVYIEAAIGIENIFNLLRVDLVKRITYLDNPNIPSFNGLKGIGIRFRLRFNF